MGSCNSSDDPGPDARGAFEVEFDNVAGTEQLALENAGSEQYPYVNANGQAFHITKFGYYISKIRLEGPNGELYEDELNISANADEVKGYYQIQESDASSQTIELKNITPGKYHSITFTVGIEEDGVQEGAAGGILDPAAGAWFWNWNAGYIGMLIEGKSPASPQPQSTHIEANAFALHIGGWKDVAPEPGESQKFVNNIRTITLDFDTPVTVAENLKPRAHLIVDVLKVLDGSAHHIDFASDYAIHSPGPGKSYADNMTDAFVFDHVHQ